MPYYYIAPRKTGYGDFAAQLILLMHLPLGDTTRLWGMEAVYLVLIPSWLTNNTLYGVYYRRHKASLDPT